MTRRDYIGLEFDWFALDSDGFLAVFSSAGWGPIPDAVFEKNSGQELIEKHLFTLRGGPSQGLISDDPGSLATCGLFAFDWKNTYGPYERIAVPDSAVRAQSLGLGVEAASQLILLPNIRFKACLSLCGLDIPSFTDVENRRG